MQKKQFQKNATLDILKTSCKISVKFLEAVNFPRNYLQKQPPEVSCNRKKGVLKYYYF